MKAIIGIVGIGLCVCVVLTACASDTSSTTDATNTKSPTSVRDIGRATIATQPAYHGYVLVKDADFWETDSYMCNALEEAAVDAGSGQQVDVNSMQGHHNITAGTRVAVIGHKSGYCPGHTVKLNVTEVEVHDGSSGVNGMDGYIWEGMLTKQ